jgi:hypothetical protein
MRAGVIVRRRSCVNSWLHASMLACRCTCEQVCLRIGMHALKRASVIAYSMLHASVPA